MSYEDILIRESTGEGMGQPPWCSACERDVEDCVCEELSDHFRAVCSCDSGEDVRDASKDVPASPEPHRLQLTWPKNLWPDWIATERNNLNDPAGFSSLGTPQSFSEWLESHGDYLPLPNSFQEWLDRGNDAIKQANRDEAYLDQGHLHT